MNNLINKINRWADKRNLKQADPKIQWMRITEEVGEIRVDLDVTECLSIAYEEIKNRKGKMVNGTFVKEEDL